MNSSLKLIPMSRRSLELLYLLTDNCHDPIREPDTFGTVIRFEHFESISHTFANKKNLSAALSGMKPILKLYGFYLTCVIGSGYLCHKSLAYQVPKFDQRFYGIPSLDREIIRGEKK